MAIAVDGEWVGIYVGVAVIVDVDFGVAVDFGVSVDVAFDVDVDDAFAKIYENLIVCNKNLFGGRN